MELGRWVLLAVVGGVLAFGGWRAASDGRFRGTRKVRGGPETVVEHVPPRTDSASRPLVPSVLAGTSYDGQRGERATLLQFSSAFCAPCRATRRTLADVADAVPGVSHLEVDAESNLDLVRRLDVLRTPTTLVLDADGREVSRATGAPRRDQVVGALERSL